MNIERRQAADTLEIVISGRLDAHWSEHLDREIEGAVREGARRIHLATADIDYISSAGIRVLLKYWKQLRAIGGVFAVVSPSAAVRNIITLSGMTDLLLSSAAEDRTAVTPGAADSRFTFHHPHPGKRLALRLVGQPEKLARGGFAVADVTALDLPRDTMALGLGAFGADREAARSRCGEFLAAGGVAICQPTDGAARPDDQVAAGDFVPRIQAVYALACRGTFGHFFTFAPDPAGGAENAPLPLSALTETAFSLCDAPAAAFVFIAETDGLVGAALRRSPLDARNPDLFALPDARDWFSLTTERVHPKTLVLVAGVAAADDPLLAPFVRPLWGSGRLSGHIHAAVLSYRALPGGILTLSEMTASLMETQNLIAVLHLLNDSRPIAGIGESLFIRGAAWAGPLDISTAGRDA